MKQGTVVAPGAFNALVACAVERAGFSACYISGGASANVAGYPDVGFHLDDSARVEASGRTRFEWRTS